MVLLVGLGLGILVLISITCNFVFGSMSSTNADISTIVGQVIKNIFKSNDETTPITGQISDNILDWVHLGNFSNLGDPSTDIVAVDYTNDGRFLNATLWLFSPVKAKPPQNEEISYGMLIDSDNDMKTGGIGGIDYQLDATFDNESQTWRRTLNSFSPRGDLEPMETPEGHGIGLRKNNVKLSLDLDSIRHQRFYKVNFYAETKRNDSVYLDVTNAANFPPLEVSISAFPPSIVLRPGESKSIEVRLNSTKGYEPIVNLSAASSSDVVSKFAFNTLRIPSYGMTTTPLAIFVPSNISINSPTQYTIIITANSMLRTSYIQTGNQPLFNPTTSPVQYTITVEVLPPLDFAESLGLVSSGIPLNIPKEYLLGFYGIVLSLIIPGIARWFNRRRQMKYVNQYMTTILSGYDSNKQNKDECLRSLENIRRQVDLSFAKGRVDESNYKILNGKISEYQKQLEPQFDTKDDQKQL